MRAPLLLATIFTLTACDLFSPWKQNNPPPTGCPEGATDCMVPPTCEVNDPNCSTPDGGNNPSTCRGACTSSGCWEPICLSLLGTQELSGVWIAQSGTVWVVTKQGKIYSLKPGNGTPNIANTTATEAAVSFMPRPGLLNAIAGTGDDDIWAGGEKNVLLHRNGNASWDGPAPQSTDAILDVSGSSPNDYWAIAEQIKLMHWTGSSWSLSIPTGGSLHGVWTSSDGDAYICGVGGQISKVPKSGGAVTNGVSPTNRTLFDIFGNRNNDIWVVGGSASAGVIVHFNGSSGVIIEEGTKKGLLGVWSDGTNVWAVGHEGRIARWDGSNVTEETSSTLERLNAVYGHPTVGVWAVGAGGTVLHRIP